MIDYPHLWGAIPKPGDFTAGRTKRAYPFIHYIPLINNHIFS
jgi:hypothetical protein